MSYPLHHVRVGSPHAPRVGVVLHGILGAGNNWRSFARHVVTAAPDWQLVLPDLRNHGGNDSVGDPPPEPHTVDACADDVLALCAQLGLKPELIIGHSYGGKVALAAAERSAHPVAAAWALDSPPGAGKDDGRGTDVAAVLDALRQVPVPLQRRDEVRDFLRARGLSDAIGAWMTTNLRRSPDGLVWKFHLPAIEPMLREYLRRDLWTWLDAPERRTAVHIVRAGRSDRWHAAELARFASRPPAAAALHLHTLANAGHWVHVDDPAGLAALLRQHALR